jgi:hypothetical protein
MLKALLILLLSTSQGGPPLVVSMDLGGQIGARGLHIWRLGDRPVQIVGHCESACTMYLGARDVCVTPDARLIFHGPSWYGIPMARVDFDVASRYIAGHYPASLSAWFMETGRFGRYGIDGSEIIANGWAKTCPTER